MARGKGGRRQGAPGKSYSNRTDLNVDRAPQPGSSAAPLPAASEQGPAPVVKITPDSIPSLDTPTMYPSRPVTDGIPSGPGTGAPARMALSDRPLYDPLRASLRRDPTNYALRRIAAYLEARGDV
jgi:hypothetical protein